MQRYPTGGSLREGTHVDVPGESFLLLGGDVFLYWVSRCHVSRPNTQSLTKREKKGVAKEGHEGGEMWLKITRGFSTTRKVQRERRYVQFARSRVGEDDVASVLKAKFKLSEIEKKVGVSANKGKEEAKSYKKSEGKRERERERERGKWKEFLKRLRHPKLSIPGTNLSRKRADDSILMATTRTAVGKGKKSERGNGSEQKYFPSFHQFNYSNNRLTLQKGSVEVVPFTSPPNLTSHQENRSPPQRNESLQSKRKIAFDLTG
ncbi:hypothetical protein RUM43_009389 [Polyplax serrata]|uniref:Uncharacterized protein n=1 Tax=Polyplax serrata TaxID=468196 RepID=A0AAN8S8I3_POLSC